ncbi:MAG: NfeD family protein [Elusimicrobiota bacterium]
MGTQLWMWWLLISIIFFIIEILSPSVFFFACLGVGALFGLFASLVISNTWVQWAIFFVGSVVFVVLSRPLAKKFAAGSGQTRNSNVDELIGKKAVVIKEITAMQKGNVRVDNEDWLASGTENIGKDEIVEIIKVEGVTLFVKK